MIISVHFLAMLAAKVMLANFFANCKMINLVQVLGSLIKLIDP